MGALFAQLKQTQYICRNKGKRDMKARDLMIGDWVNMPNDEGILTPMQIESFYFDALFADGCEHYEEDCSPIPLTKEIIQKNWSDGWNVISTIVQTCSISPDLNNSIGFQIVKGSDEIFVQFHRCGGGSFELRKHIRYVHELQHILRLLEIDKEIVL